MRIAEHSVGLAAHSATLSQQRTTTRLEASTPQPRSAPDATRAATGKEEKLASGPLDWRIELMRLMIEAMTGERIDVADLSDLGQADAPPADASQAASNAPVLNAQIETESLDYQSLRFAANGVVKTTDGREFAFSAELSIETFNYQRSSVSAQLGGPPRQAKDPLVLQFNGNAPELLAQTHNFDLDADGQMDQIARLGRGNGYLAFDANGNGQIDDGRELFGPTSGDGYAELAQYDSDGNQWIDENDAIWAKLSIWLDAGGGDQKLVSLKDAGVGAIYLGRVRGDHALGGQDKPLGLVRQLGMWLSEQGQAHTMQHIDLVV
ncbi:hypothetical protein ACTSKR_10055 [Chitinibacteraceae bacterium HSL-7]